MSSLARKLKRNQERTDLLKKYGKKPKTHCPLCRKFTLFKRIKGKSKYDKEKIVCVQCKGVVK